MKKFPSPIGIMKGYGHKMFLNDEQKEWLKKAYPVNENKRIAKAMGIGISRLRDFARELGLEKSEEGKKIILRRSRIAAAKTNEKNGCYDRKRGHPVSEATMAGCRRRWEEERMGLRENPQKRIKREEPEKYRVWVEKRSHERKESIRKEKMRMMYGLERKTKLKPVVLVPYSKSQIHHRSNALKRGYVLDVECSEGSESRYVIYYDEDTKRNARFENNCIADGFKIMPW